MAKVVGKNVSIYLEDSAGASTSFSGNANSLSFSYSIDDLEVTTFGDDNHQFSPGGLKSWEVSVDGFYDMPSGNACAAFGIMNSASGRTLVKWGMGGSVTGCLQYIASAMLSEFSSDAAVDGMITYSMTIKPRAGSLSASTW